MIAPGCSELQLPAVKPAGKSRFTTFWGAIILWFIYLKGEVMYIKIESSRLNKSKKNNWLRLFIIASAFLLLSQLAKMFAIQRPDLIEKYFSRGLYPVTSRIQTGFSNLLPFSLYEALIVIIILYALFRIIRLIQSISKRSFKFEGLRFLIHLYLFVSMGLFLFQFLWSLNNYRNPLKDQLELTVQDTSTAKLDEVYRALITSANETRSKLSETQDTVSHPFKTSIVLNSAWEGYHRLAMEYPIFHSNRVRVKGLLLSRIQTIAGYSGVYNFFTGEPNINTEPPLVTLPHTACHEIAHQMGITLEDEANYVGFLACKDHHNVLFQYSGYLSALTFVGNSLYQQSPELYSEASQLLSDDIKADQQEISLFWDKYENDTASEIADKFNEVYLKSNNQTDGMKSYGKFVDLLIADYLKNGSI